MRRVFRRIKFYGFVSYLNVSRLRFFNFFKKRFNGLNAVAAAIYDSKNVVNKKSTVFSEFVGVDFVGCSFFNLYVRLFFCGQKRAYIFKRFLQFYSFFYLTVKIKLEDVFLSFLLSKFITKAMSYGKKFVFERLFVSVFHSLKWYAGLSVSSLFFSTFMALRLPLIRTSVVLAGRTNTVPTPSLFDKQFKFGLRLFVSVIKRRKYLRDKIKKILFKGRYVGRRIPFYRRFVKLSSLLVNVQSFFLISSKKYQNLRFLKNDVFSSIKKNMFLFLLQRTYMQYR
jgi:hypothetical protein